MTMAQSYLNQSRIFLDRARQYLEENDLHQASEKGWGAATHMAKAVAETQGWSYGRHDEFFKVMRQAQESTGDDRLRAWTNSANALHGFFYWRREALDSATIAQDIDDVASMHQALEPLTIAS